MVASLILFAVLGLPCLVVAQEFGPDFEITRFPLNPTYGFAKSVEPVSKDTYKYLLLIFDCERSGETDIRVIDSVVSTSRPQLCDSNAVSVIVRHRPDSAILVVVDFDPLTAPDTIIAYPFEKRKSSFSWKPGEGRLYNLNRYLFFRPDSLLFWLLPGARYSILEIGRILPDGLYETKDGCFRCPLPRLTGDFTMALYSRLHRTGAFGPSEDDLTQIIAYDFALDSSYVLRLVKGDCSSPQLLRRDDRLFCIWSESMDVSTFCVVEDSIPLPLFSIEYPVSYAGYELYQDSIVIRTTNCCDEDYGIQTHVIPR